MFKVSKKTTEFTLLHENKEVTLQARQSYPAACHSHPHSAESLVRTQTSVDLIKPVPPRLRMLQPVHTQLLAVLSTLVPNALKLNPKDTSHALCCTD